MGDVYFEGIDFDDQDSRFCGCGVTIDVEDGEECSVCAGAPHHRECPCNECDVYWAQVEELSRAVGGRPGEGTPP